MSLKDETIRLKLSKAYSTLSEIDVMMQNKFYTTAISRLYYSCFHATKALLLTKDLMPKTHKGTSTTLHQHFVSTGLFDNEKTKFFDKLMQERIEDDYGDRMILDEVLLPREQTRAASDPSASLRAASQQKNAGNK